MVNRLKMDRERRAKQFMAFDALKGYHEALRKKEEEIYDNHTDELIKDKSEIDFLYYEGRN